MIPDFRRCMVVTSCHAPSNSRGFPSNYGPVLPAVISVGSLTGSLVVGNVPSPSITWQIWELGTWPYSMPSEKSG